MNKTNLNKTDLKKVNLFMDMDGVLAVYQENIVDYMYKKDFFLNRPPIQVMLDVVNKLTKEDYELHILSSVIDTPYCIKEKNLWLDKYLPKIDKAKVVFVPYGTVKSEHAKDKANTEDAINVLIDDLTDNLDNWTLSGALPIKFLNGINNTKGTWLARGGDFISIEDNSDDIVSHIKELIHNKQMI